MDTYSLLALFSQSIVWLEGDFFILSLCELCSASVCVFSPFFRSFFISFLKHTEPLSGAPTRRRQKGVGSVSAPIGSIILANLMSPIQAEITQKHISVNGQQNCRYRPLSAWARHLTLTIGTQFIRSLVEPLQTKDQNKHLADWLFQSRRANRAESGLPCKNQTLAGAAVFSATNLRCFTQRIRFQRRTCVVPNKHCFSSLRVTTVTLTCEAKMVEKTHNTRQFVRNVHRQSDHCVSVRNVKLSSTSFVLHWGIWRPVLHEK